MAGVMWDHDYAMFTEEQTLDRNYTHLRSRFGLRRFASSDEEIRFHTGYVCVWRSRAWPQRRNSSNGGGGCVFSFATYQLLSAFWELVEPGGADVAASPVTTVSSSRAVNATRGACWNHLLPVTLFAIVYIGVLLCS